MIKINKGFFMQNAKQAFTMIEVVFVIVILGILAGVAIPKLSATRSDAQIAKARANIASIRSAIVTERQTRLIRGQRAFVPKGTATYTVTGDTNTYKQMDNGGLFGGVLTYPIANIASTNGKWSSSTSGEYKFRINNVDTTFIYSDSTGADKTKYGTFVCAAGTNDCDVLTQ